MRNKLRAAWEARAGRLGIQWHIMAWLTLFVAVLMLLLWLFQVVLLDWFYQAIKTHDIREIARAIAQDIDDDDLSRRLEGLRRQPDLYLRILDREGNSVYQSRPVPQSMIHDLDREEIASFFQQAEKNGSSGSSFPPPSSATPTAPAAGASRKIPPPCWSAPIWRKVRSRAPSSSFSAPPSPPWTPPPTP